MKENFKRLLAKVILLFFIFSLIPKPLPKTIKVLAADYEESQYMKYQTNISSAYNIWGNVNGWKQTTFANNGFRAILNIGSSPYSLTNMSNGVEKILGSIGVKLNLSIVNNGRYVKIEYVLRNTSSSNQTISLGSGADIQIGSNDSAPITKFDDGSGFYMTGDGAQFNFIGKDAYGVTNVDTYWYGFYGDVNSNMFNQIDTSSYSGDSGMAYSWKNRVIGANSTQSFSVLIGIGSVNKAPVINISNPAVSFPDGKTGEAYSFSGTVSDAENTNGTEVYYAIDNRNPVKAYTFSAAPGTFTSSITIPSDITSGVHNISFFAQDNDGAVSSTVNRTINLIQPLTLTAHDLSYITGGEPQYIDPNFTVSSGLNITGGKIYIDQYFDSSKDSLSFTNMDGITGSYNSVSGVLTLSGTASAENYQSFIRNVKLNTTSMYGNRKITITLYNGLNNIYYYSGTGHYYEYVPAWGITWTDAKVAAENRTYEGLNGYLATITSAGENAFVAEKCAGDGWLGGTDEGHDKEWYWVTGPEAGSKFAQQNSYNGLNSGNGIAYTVDGWYQNFDAGEPNDYPNGEANGENYLHMYAGSGKWNDFSINNSRIQGYLVEYGDKSNMALDSTATINVNLLDKIPPAFTVSKNPSSWTKGDVTVNISASDSGSGLNNLGAYSFDGGNTWSNNSSMVFSSNGTVAIKVRDNDGNIGTETVVIDNIDKIAPSFSSITQSPTTWTENSVYLTVNGAADLSSGLASTAYSFSTTLGVYNWQSSNKSNNYEENSTIYVYVRDAAGNISSPAVVNITNIDKTLPNTPVINNSNNYTSNNWYKENQTVTANFNRTTGSLETIQYKLNDGEWIDGSTVEVSEERVNTLKFRVIDELGRTSGEANCLVQIDKTAPRVLTEDKDYSWRNSDFNIILNYSDLGGASLKNIEYGVTNTTNAPSSWIGANQAETLTINKEGVWYIHYRAFDNAGNSTNGYFGPYMLDKTSPEGTIDIIPSKTFADYKFTRSQIVSINLTGEDKGSGVYQIRLANSSDELLNASFESFIPTKTNFRLSDGNGIKKVYYQIKDNANNLSPIYEDTIYFDNAKPTIAISEPSKFIVRGGDVITYTLTLTDNSKNFGNDEIALNDGIDKINLLEDKIILSVLGSIDLNEINKTIEDVEGKPLKKLIKIYLPSNMTGEGSLNIKIAEGAIEDKAGNLSGETICRYPLNIDNVKPENGNLILKRDLYVKGGSIIKLDSTSAESGGLESDSVRFAPINYSGLPADNLEITSTHGNSLYISAPINEGTYYIYVVDSAGNISEPSIKKLIVDSTGPIVSISEPNKIYGKSDSKIEYTVTFAEDAALESIENLFKEEKIRLVTTGTANALIAIEKVPESERQRKVVLSNFTGDGTIERLIISPDVCEDSIGNPSLEVLEFTKINVDNTVPTVSEIIFKKVNGDILSKIINFLTFNYFSNEKINVTIEANDLGGSELSKIYYKTNENDEYTEANPVDGKVVFTLEAGFKGYIFAYSEDNSGNKSAVIKSDGVVLENTAPEINVEPLDLTNWFKDDLSLNVKVIDNEGIKEIRYTVDGELNVIDMVQGYSDKELLKKFNILLNTDSSSHVIQINAVDLAGNSALTYNGIVKLDKTAPIIKSICGNPSDWTDESVTLVVDVKDQMSGLSDKPYSFDGGNTWQAENTKTYDKNTSGIVIKVRDAANNETSYEEINITKIDKTEPNTAEINNSSSYIEDNWFNTNQLISGSFAATEGCSEKLQYKVDDGAWTDGDEVAINEEGLYRVSFRVIDYLGRTSKDQTVNVNIDKTAPKNLTILIGENKFEEFLNKITFGLFFKESVDVRIEAEGNISGIKNYEYMIVDTSLGESYDNGTWKIGDSFTISPQFKGVIFARAIDNALNTTDVICSNGLVVDGEKPTKAVINAKVEGGAYEGVWTKEDISIVLTNSEALSGIDYYEYKIGENGTYKPMPKESGAIDEVSLKGIMDKLLIDFDIEDTIYFRAVSNSKVIGDEVSIVVKRDSKVPEISIDAQGTVNSWTTDKVTFTLRNNSENIAPVKFYVKEGSNEFVEIAGNQYTIDKETNNTYVFKTVTEAGLEDISKIYEVKIDRTNPEIFGAKDKEGYFIGRIIEIKDSFGEISKATYTLDNGEKTEFNNGALFSLKGSYILKLIDKAGNESSISFNVKGLPKVSDILYNEESKKLIEEIRKEYDSHSDLTEPYKTNINNEIEKLEKRYSDLDKEVKDLKKETEKIKDSVNKLNGNDGLLSLKDEILTLYNKMTGSSSTLTKEQKEALREEKVYLESLLKNIAGLEREIEELKKLIEGLVSPEKVGRQDLEEIQRIDSLFKNLNEEQRKALGDTNINKLNSVEDYLRKLMLHDEITDTTVIGIDGTTFKLGIYIKVDPIKEENEESFLESAKEVESAAKLNSSIEGKELIELYEITMYEGNIRIQPNGKVQVRIKISENLLNRDGLDVIHIAENGKITPMNAVRDGDYLVFTTEHFSKYGIVAKDNCIFGICKALGLYNPVKGICYDYIIILLTIAAAILTVFSMYKNKNRKEKRKVQA